MGCTHLKINPPELPKSFELSATKMESTIDTSFRMMLFPFDDNNLRAALYPKLKGIPDSLKNIRTYLFPLDYIQSIFQEYKAGKINKMII